MHPVNTPSPPTVSLTSYLAFVWRKGWLFVLAFIVGIGLSLVYLAWIQPQYTISMVVAPVDTETHDMGEIGALGSILKMGNTTDNAIDAYHDLILTPFFAERLIEKHQILQVLYPDTWDPVAQRWREPTGLAYGIKKQLFALIGRTAWTPPSANSVAAWLGQQLEITPTAEDAFINLQLRTADVTSGMHLMTWIHAEADAIMRTRQVRNTTARIRYLQNSLDRTRSIERQRAMLQLLAIYENKLVAIDNDLPFAVEVIATPRPSDGPTDPSPFKIILMMLAVSMTGVCVITWLWYLRHLERQSETSQES